MSLTRCRLSLHQHTMISMGSQVQIIRLSISKLCIHIHEGATSRRAMVTHRMQAEALARAMATNRLQQVRQQSCFTITTILTQAPLSPLASITDLSWTKSCTHPQTRPPDASNHPEWPPELSPPTVQNSATTRKSAQTASKT